MTYLITVTYKSQEYINGAHGIPEDGQAMKQESVSQDHPDHEPEPAHTENQLGAASDMEKPGIR